MPRGFPWVAWKATTRLRPQIGRSTLRRSPAKPSTTRSHEWCEPCSICVPCWISRLTHAGPRDLCPRGALVLVAPQ